jgi:hypothetical protein
MGAKAEPRGASAGAWWQAVGHAAILCILILAPLAYWFGVANRHTVFLYAHMGAGPFDAVTIGRYWMASLVASGGAVAVYVAYCWVRGRLAVRKGSAWAPPVWCRVWAVGAPLVGCGAMAITMALGAPTLPLALALAGAAASVVGLAGAAAPGALAARDPGELPWLVAHAAALVPPLVLLRLVAPEARAHLGDASAATAAALSLAAALGWGAILARLRRWRRRAMPAAASLYAGGLIEAYLLLPVLHYWLSDLGEPCYITGTENLFPAEPLVQAVILVVVAGLAQSLTRLGRRGLV